MLFVVVSSKRPKTLGVYTLAAGPNISPIISISLELNN